MNGSTRGCTQCNLLGDDLNPRNSDHAINTVQSATRPIASNQQYRRDIDGLRAVAVLSVLIYHVRQTVLPGGFVGVDIFFVISGFLITSQIYQELRAGAFTLRQFYQRRINRIVPALLAVVLTCLAAGAIVLSPMDLTRLAISAVLSLIGLSNVYFWREYGDYFHGDTSEAVLLHTWSLGVEEQFYVVWPLLLLLLVKFTPRHVFGLLTGLMLAALAFSAHWTKALPLAAYYLLPMRFFELMLGGALAVRAAHGIVLTRAQADLCSALGFALIAGALCTLNDESSFPGLNALYPCLGAALLILAGCAGYPARVLSARVMVFFGLISYSLYLWHWPIVAYSNYLNVPPGAVKGILVVAGSILLAWLTWRFVEQPLRTTGRSLSFSRVFIRRFAIPAVGLLVLAGFTVKFHGFPRRFDPMVATFESMAAAKPNELRSRCHMKNAVYIPDSSYQAEPLQECHLGTPKPVSDGVLIGDSFANHYTGMVDILARADGIAITDYTMDGCPPILGYSDIKVASYAERCAARNTYAFGMLAKRKYKYVILAGSWPQDPHAGGAIEATLQKVLLTGAQAIVILSNQTIEKAAACPVRQLIFLQTADCTTSQSEQPGYWRSIRARYPAIRFIDPNELICQQGRCRPVIRDTLLYRDSGHLNDYGSRLLGNMFLSTGHTLLR